MLKFRKRISIVLVWVLAAIIVLMPNPDNRAGAAGFDWTTGTTVQTSQYGYHPDHKKDVFYTGAGSSTTFEVRKASDNSVIFTGSLVQKTGDFGAVKVGDFSSLATEGEYYIQIGSERTFRTFEIKQNLWDEYQRMIAMNFFALRRAGEDNLMGNGGISRYCRWDDAKGLGGKGYKYIGRAWLDGDDVRTYASCSLVVAQYCELKRTNPFWDRNDWIYEQVRWGLDGALSFLDEDGVIRLIFCANPDNDGDGVFYNGDEKPLGDVFDAASSSNEYNGENPEVVYTSLLLGPAEAVYLFHDKDPEYFDRVKELVIRGYNFIYNKYNPFPQKYSLGTWIWLNSLMYQITNDVTYKNRAIAEADRFLLLQQTTVLGDGVIQAKGWFRDTVGGDASPWGEKPEQEIMITPWIYQGLFKLVEYFPQDANVQRWKDSIRSYARDYLMEIGKCNPYGMSPAKAGFSGLKRQKGTLSYQYFCNIGRMFHQAGNAAFLMKTGKLLGDQAIIDAAWKHCYWFTGANPMGMGLIYGLSDNIPSGQYDPDNRGRAFPGGITNGPNGDASDNMTLNYFEYYTYANVNSLWLATEIGAAKIRNPMEMWPKEISEARHSASPDTHTYYSFPLRMKGGFTYKFFAVLRDDPANNVRWYINGILGGNAGIGTITGSGDFTAPFVTAETTVTVKAESVQNPSVSEQTNVLIMPVPQQVANFTAQVVGLVNEPRKVSLAWDPVATNCAGYTIWMRLPVGEKSVGTNFERITAVSSGTTGFTYTGGCPAGTQFLVKAYNKTSAKIYGFGKESNIVTVNQAIGPVECENLLYNANVTVSEVPDADGSNWAVIKANSSNVNDYLQFKLNVDTPGQYKMMAGVKKGNSRGIVKLSIDGADVGIPLDHYSAIYEFAELDYGNVQFSNSGDKWFKFTVTGKNSSSSGMDMAFDYLKLVLSDGSTPTPSASPIPTPTPTPTPFEGATLFSDNFEDGDAAGWTNIGGTWSVVSDGSHVYKNSYNSGEVITYTGNSSWTDYSVEGKIKLYETGFTSGAGLLGRYADANNFYMFRIIGPGKIQLYKRVGGTFSLMQETAASIQPNVTYTLKLFMKGSSITGYVDGEERCHVVDTAFISGKTGLRGFDVSYCVDDIVVKEVLSTTLTPTPSPTPTPTTVPTPTPTPVFMDNFEDGDSVGWTVVNGTWAVATDGTKVYKQSLTTGEALARAGNTSWTDYSITAKVKLYSTGLTMASGILARYTDSNNYYMLRLCETDRVQLYKKVGGTFTLLQEVSMTVNANSWYTLKLSLNGSVVTGYVDGVQKVSVTDNSLASGCIGVRCYSQAAGFDEVTVN
jgi:hypothetical protein